MQLALTVQLPPNQGGVSGSAYYICTREALRTERLQQIIDGHPLLSPQWCGLCNVHTQKAPSYNVLLRLLKEAFPAAHKSSQDAYPGKLLIIDTFSDLFDATKDPTYDDRYLRAKHLREVSLVLHRLAADHKLAILLLSSSQFSPVRIDDYETAPDLLLYADQERWFSRAHSMPGEDAHEGSLGLIWSNQLNARIMMSRTTRTRARVDVDPDAYGERPNKKMRLDTSSASAGSGDEPIPFRRMSVIFSSVAPPASCDYVVVRRGVVGSTAIEPPPSTFMYTNPMASSQAVSTTQVSLGATNVTTAAALRTDSHQDPVSRGSDSGAPSTSTDSSQRSTSAVAAPGLSSPPSTPPGPILSSRGDEEMYWRHTQLDDDIFSQIVESDSKEAAAPTDGAEDGPPPNEVEGDGHGGHASSDSEHYWNDTDDGIAWNDV